MDYFAFHRIHEVVAACEENSNPMYCSRFVPTHTSSSSDGLSFTPEAIMSAISSSTVLDESISSCSMVLPSPLSVTSSSSVPVGSD